MRISADGFIHLRKGMKVRTPGRYESKVDPIGASEAMSFLLSHTFAGHRKIVRAPNSSERRKLRLASWADSVNDRMDLVDRVWRAITVPAIPNGPLDEPQLVQVVMYNGTYYPVYLDGEVTKVLPQGGVDDPMMAPGKGKVDLDLSAAEEGERVPA